MGRWGVSAGIFQRGRAAGKTTAARRFSPAGGACFIYGLSPWLSMACLLIIEDLANSLIDFL
jgi:hypothetical protein